MQVKKYSASEERIVLTSLIVHDQVLSRVHSALAGDKEPFKSRWSNIIASWCFDFFAEYKKAPRGAISSRFTKFAESSKDEDSVELIGSFLDSLSKEYDRLADEMNEQYLVDTASSYFQKIRLERLSEDINDALSDNDIEKARKAHANFQPLSFASSDWADPFNIAEISDSFRRKEDDRSILIPLKGDMGIFMSPYLKEGGFISFVGPEKRGKSFWLMEMVWQALRARRRVLYYAIGDMSKDEIKMRLYVRISKLPNLDHGQKEIEIALPTAFRAPKKKDEGYSVDYKPKEWYPAISGREVYRATKVLRTEAADGSSRLKLLCRGAGEVTASMIEADVLECRRNGWVPDVVVVDYADLLAPEESTRRMDYRHQVDLTWKILRRIPLNNHGLLLTATQANSESYNVSLLGPEHFSEDKRKNAHVTGMCGLNQTPDEYELGIYRLNWIFLRGGKWSRKRVIYTMGNLLLANPCLLNTL